MRELSTTDKAIPILIAAMVIGLYLAFGGDPDKVEKGFEALDDTIEMYDRVDKKVQELEEKFESETSEVTQ